MAQIADTHSPPANHPSLPPTASRIPPIHTRAAATQGLEDLSLALGMSAPGENYALVNAPSPTWYGLAQKRPTVAIKSIELLKGLLLLVIERPRVGMVAAEKSNEQRNLISVIADASKNRMSPSGTIATRHYYRHKFAPSGATI